MSRKGIAVEKYDSKEIFTTFAIWNRRNIKRTHKRSISVHLQIQYH